MSLQASAPAKGKGVLVWSDLKSSRSSGVDMGKSRVPYWGALDPYGAPIHQRALCLMHESGNHDYEQVPEYGHLIEVKH